VAAVPFILRDPIYEISGDVGRMYEVWEIFCDSALLGRGEGGVGEGEGGVGRISDLIDELRKSGRDWKLDGSGGLWLGERCGGFGGDEFRLGGEIESGDWVIV